MGSQLTAGMVTVNGSIFETGNTIMGKYIAFHKAC